MTSKRATTLADSMVHSGYVGIALDRFVKQAARIVGAAESCLFVRDRDDDGRMIIAAGKGIDHSLIGKRVASQADVWGDRRPTAAVSLSASGDPLGKLSMRTAHGDRRLTRDERRVLVELGRLAASGLAGANHDSAGRSKIRPKLRGLATRLEARDGYTADHSEQTVELAYAVGRRLGLQWAALCELELAALLHDLGKVRMPDAVLKKRGPLDGRERALIRMHPGWGSQLIATVPCLEVVATIVRFHHERFDGGGYPDHLPGDRIPLASRIITVCDAYSAMVRDRPYRRALSGARAFGQLKRGAGTQFDPLVVDAFTAEALDEQEAMIASSAA